MRRRGSAASDQRENLPLAVREHGDVCLRDNSIAADLISSRESRVFNSLRRHLQPAAALNDVITSAARLALLSLSRPFGSAPLPFQDLSDQFQSASDNFRETSFSMACTR